MRTSATLLIATLLGAVPLSAQETLTGSWTAQFREAGEVNLHVTFSTEATGMSNWGRSFGQAEFAGLTLPRAAGQSLRFTMPRAAGTFTFEGRGDPESGAGWFEFRPSGAYLQQFQGLGLERPTLREAFAFAYRNLTIAEVRELREAVSDELTTSKLMRMMTHGVDPEFVREMGKLGFKELSTDELVRTRDHGVTPAFVRALRAEGYDEGLSEVIRVRDHGVDPKYIRGMRALGFDASIGELVRARDHGVSPGFVESLQEAGYKGLSLGMYIRMRDHGVTPGYARRMVDRMKERPSAEELVRLRSRGID